MDLDEFRSFILDSGVDVWSWIDMAISVADQNELKIRRDSIIQKLYAPTFCHNCQNDVGFHCNTQNLQLQKKMVTHNDDEEQSKILEIKILLHDQTQSERCLIELLERLVGMNITFKALKKTDIGRHVTKLRKHSSNEVRRLVKILVRKWKDTVDEWVRLNTPTEEEQEEEEDHATQFNAHHESIHNGEVLHQNASVSCYSTPSKIRKVKHNQIESDDQIYHESQNVAKKQRTTQSSNGFS